MQRFQQLARCLAVLLFAGPVVSVSKGIDPSPDDLVTFFVAAWNAHDTRAFGRLLASDADWVTASGLRLRGREQIQDYLAGEHATWAKTTTMKSLGIHVRTLDEKRAVVMFEWQIATPGESGSAPTIARGNNLFVLEHEQGWLIVSGQVARARTP